MASESMDQNVNLRPCLPEELQACKSAIAETKRDLETNRNIISHFKYENGVLLNATGTLEQKQRHVKAQQAKVKKGIQQLQRELRQKEKSLYHQTGQLQELQHMLQSKSDQLAHQRQINCYLEDVLKQVDLQLPCHLTFPAYFETESAMTGEVQTNAGTVPTEENNALLHVLGHHRQPEEGARNTACQAETEPTESGGAQTPTGTNPTEEKDASMHALDHQCQSEEGARTTTCQAEMEQTETGGAQTTAGTITTEEKDDSMHALDHHRQPEEGRLTTAFQAEREPMVAGGAQTAAGTITAGEMDASLHAMEHLCQPEEGTLTSVCQDETEPTEAGGAQTSAGTIPAKEKDASLLALDYQCQHEKGMLAIACQAENEPTETRGAQITVGTIPAEEKDASMHALDHQLQPEEVTSTTACQAKTEPNMTRGTQTTAGTVSAQERDALLSTLDHKQQPAEGRLATAPWTDIVHTAIQTDKLITENQRGSRQHPLSTLHPCIGEKELTVALQKSNECKLAVTHVSGKGKGIISKENFKKGEIITEYNGNVISFTEAKRRELDYLETAVGNFMMFFKYKERQYCIDATEDDGSLGRLINHSRKGNCKPKLLVMGTSPRIVFEATRDIEIGEEILYDYGDKRREVVSTFPWLKT